MPCSLLLEATHPALATPFQQLLGLVQQGLQSALSTLRLKRRERAPSQCDLLLPPRLLQEAQGLRLLVQHLLDLQRRWLLARQPAPSLLWRLAPSRQREQVRRLPLLLTLLPGSPISALKRSMLLRFQLLQILQ